MALLPVNIDSTYVNRHAGDSLHQQHHDQIHAKLNQRIDVVADYGAVGDNSTDDTAAIQAAHDAVEALGGGILYFPSMKTFKITSTITWNPVVRWVGGQGRVGLGLSRPRLMWHGADGGTMVQTDVVGGGGSTNMHITGMENLFFDGYKGSGTNYAGKVLDMVNRGDHGTILRNLSIQNAEYGIHWPLGGINVTIYNVRVDRCEVAGIYWKVHGVDTLSIDGNCTFDNMRSDIATGGRALIVDATASADNAFLVLNMSNVLLEENLLTGSGRSMIEFWCRTDRSQPQINAHLDSVQSNTGKGVLFTPSNDGQRLVINNCNLTVTGVPGYTSPTGRMVSGVIAPWTESTARTPTGGRSRTDFATDVDIWHYRQQGKQVITTRYTAESSLTAGTTLLPGEWLFDPANVNADRRVVKECYSAGTVGTLAITGDITTGTASLTVSDSSSLRAGQYLQIGAYQRRITRVDYATHVVTLISTVPATYAATAITWVAPLYREHLLGPTNYDAIRYVTATGSASYDGKSPASGKATLATAIAALPSGGGTVWDLRTGTVAEAGCTLGQGVTLKTMVSTYTLSAPIIMDHHSHLEGRGPHTGQQGTRIQPSANMTYLVRSSAISGSADYWHGSSIRNIAIDGEQAAGIHTGGGLLIHNMGEGAFVDNVHVSDCAASNIVLSGLAVPPQLRRISTMSSGGYGMEIDCADNGTDAGNAYEIELSGDNNTSGLLRVTNGNSRSIINLHNVKSERRAVGAHDPVVYCDDFGGTVNIFGMHCFADSSLATATQVVLIAGPASSRVNIIGASLTAGEYTNWINDTQAGVTVPVVGGSAHCPVLFYAAGQYTRMLADGQWIISDTTAVGAGAVGDPSLQFTNDADTGIYRPAADAVGLVGGGVETLRGSAGSTDEAYMMVRVNRGGSVTLSRVSIGAADSGGAGYRVLRVAN